MHSANFFLKVLTTRITNREVEQVRKGGLPPLFGRAGQAPLPDLFYFNLFDVTTKRCDPGKVTVTISRLGQHTKFEIQNVSTNHRHLCNLVYRDRKSTRLNSSHSS